MSKRQSTERKFLVALCQATIKSLLTHCMSGWYTGCFVADKKFSRLKPAEKITRCPLCQQGYQCHQGLYSLTCCPLSVNELQKLLSLTNTYWKLVCQLHFHYITLTSNLLLWSAEDTAKIKKEAAFGPARAQTWTSPERYPLTPYPMWWGLYTVHCNTVWTLALN